MLPGSRFKRTDWKEPRGKLSESWKHSNLYWVGNYTEVYICQISSNSTVTMSAFNFMKIDFKLSSPFLPDTYEIISKCCLSGDRDIINAFIWLIIIIK